MPSSLGICIVIELVEEFMMHKSGNIIKSNELLII